MSQDNTYFTLPTYFWKQMSLDILGPRDKSHCYSFNDDIFTTRSSTSGPFDQEEVTNGLRRFRFLIPFHYCSYLSQFNPVIVGGAHFLHLITRFYYIVLD